MKQPLYSVLTGRHSDLNVEIVWALLAPITGTQGRLLSDVKAPVGVVLLLA